MRGFDGGGFAVGEVYGARWWSVRDQGSDLVLRGAYGYDWTAGDNSALCRSSYAKHRHKVPDEHCGCGFWGYWKPEAAPIAARPRVLGIIKGWGDDTLIGDRGFRCGRARIVALCCEDIAKRTVTDGPEVYVPGPPAGVRMQDPEGFMAMFRALGGRGGSYQRVARTEDDYLLQAEIEYRLGEAYQCPVYTTFDGMLVMHPTTKDYLPPPAPPAPPPWQEELTRMAMADPSNYQQALTALTETMAEFTQVVEETTLTAGAALRKLIDMADLTDESYPIDDMAQWGGLPGLLGPD